MGIQANLRIVWIIVVCFLITFSYKIRQFVQHRCHIESISSLLVSAQPLFKLVEDELSHEIRLSNRVHHRLIRIVILVEGCDGVESCRPEYLQKV